MMRNLLWVVPGFLSLLLAGCGGESGPPTATVKGKVSLDGKPLPIGTVMFRPEKGPIASGVVDENGNYEATDVPLGTVKIYLNVPDAPPTPPMPKGPAPGEPELPHLAALPLLRKVPRICKDPQRSGMSLDVKEGENRFDVLLKSQSR